MGIPASREQIEEWARKGPIDAAPAPSAAVPTPRAKRSTATKARPRGPARVRLVVWIPGLTVRSEPNIGGKLRGKIARKIAVKEAVRGALATCLPPFAVPPVRVTMTRYGTRRLDDDNLDAAFKVVRDTVAEWLGVDDGDTAAVRFRCRQRPGYVAGVKIQIG